MTVGVAVGFCTVDDDKFAPLQLYAETLTEGVAVRVTVPPAHIGPLLLTVTVGIAFTITVVVYTVAGLQPDAPPLLTVKE